MNDTAGPAAGASTPAGPQSGATEGLDYASEVRFGVVMYGGVSLAIYINGVANEMYEMACSTPRPGAQLPLPANPNRLLDTRELYRRLSWLVGSPAACAEYAAAIGAEALRARAPGESPRDVWDEAFTADRPQTRLVVDVVAGTSAGGINGIFLAKALANGEEFGSLKNLWVSEGDIGLLLNDGVSYEGFEPPIPDRSAKPASLLNSDRMYLKLLHAMRSMPPVREFSHDQGESPLVEEIDLFVTTTDIVGAALPLRLSDMVVYERRHKQNYHFGYPEGTSGANDFVPTNNAFLAFAARCTSSFPFAFEPMTLAAVARLKADGDVPDGLRHWDKFFPNLPQHEVRDGKHASRAFGDGGYLDNKPFTYVVEALSRRQAGVPIERKLIYVEPSPEHLDPNQTPDPDNPPDALTNAMAALTSIPQYETIREDLQAVLRRNQRIERVDTIVRLGELAIDQQVDPFVGVRTEQGKVSPWSTLKLSDMVKFYGAAFLPYRRLRVYTVTDRLAERLADLWGLDRESDHLYALRALVRVWREMNYDDEAEPGDKKETINAFLDQFDTEHRMRRLRFLLRKIDQATRLLRRRRHGPMEEPQAGSLSATLSEIDRQVIDALRRKGLSLYNPALTIAEIDEALLALRALKRGLLAVRVDLQAVERRSRDAYANQHPLSAESRGLLLQVLDLMLGERPADGPPLKLATIDGRLVDVKLGEGWLKASSSSRTQQESVVYRVRALFEAAGKTSPTQLQLALEASLAPMRVKPSPRRPGDGEPLAQAINARAWALLGEPQIVAMEGGVVVVVVDAVHDGVLGASEAAALNSVHGKLLRRVLGEYYVRFDSYDQMSFPLYYDTGTGEPATVDVVRISPEDAPRLIDQKNDAQHRRKLAGTSLFNFGAFLDERWRRNDIMWGRLDGAERLIQALLPMSDEVTRVVREELIARAHGTILRDALVGQGHGELTALLCNALTSVPGADTEQRLKSLLEQLSLGDPVQRSRLGSVLMSLLSEQGLVEYMRSSHVVDRSYEPKATLHSAARAVTITGRVLEGITQRRGAKTTAPRWLARLGLLVQGLIAVSLPGTLNQRWWTHGLKVLYAFEVVMVAFAVLFGGPEARSFALTALGVTVTLHLLSLVTGDAMQSQANWRKRIVVATGVVLVALAAAGALAIHHGGWRSVLCGQAPAGDVASTGLCANGS
jgi:patatin-related protein